MLPHLLRCQWLGVGDYTLAIGRLEAGAASTFAQLGFNKTCLQIAFLFIPAVT